MGRFQYSHQVVLSYWVCMRPVDLEELPRVDISAECIGVHHKINEMEIILSLSAKNPYMFLKYMGRKRTINGRNRCCLNP